MYMCQIERQRSGRLNVNVSRRRLEKRTKEVEEPSRDKDAGLPLSISLEWLGACEKLFTCLSPKTCTDQIKGVV